MKMTGKPVTESEARHFQSIARHMHDIASPLTVDLDFCSRSNWVNLDRAYVQGKLNDFIGRMRELNDVISDMEPELFEKLKSRKKN